MRLASFFVGMLMLSLAAFANQAAFKFRVPEDVEKFVQTYYQNPRPELLAPLIEAMPMSGFFKRANSGPPFIAFFSEVSVANPSRLPEWQSIIERQDEVTRAALERAVALGKAGGVIVIEGYSGAVPDFYWGAFFASGNPAFLKKLIDMLKYWDERDNLELFLAGMSAKWSLASNAQSHVLVRSTLEAERLDRDKRTQELIAELLVQDPGRIKQDARNIVVRQREAGKWN